MRPSRARSRAAAHGSFRDALAEVWAEPQARRFTIFVFVSMLAYSAQDLILEPFAGVVFGFTPGESTKLAGVQHGGVLLGMLLVGFLGTWRGALDGCAARRGRIAGCLASALALFALAFGGLVGPTAGRCAPTSSRWARQRRVRGRGHRLDDGAGGRRAQRTRRRAHGPVGRGAGDRLRPRRLARHGGRRPRSPVLRRMPRMHTAVLCVEALVFLWAALIAMDLVSRRHATPASAATLPVAREIAE